jgi:hypothetical protein
MICLSQAPHDIAAGSSNITDVTRQFGAELDLRRVPLVTQSLLANPSLFIHSFINGFTALCWALASFSVS